MIMAMYGEQLWVERNKEKAQNSLARKSGTIPWYVRNADIPKDLELPDVKKAVSKRRNNRMIKQSLHIPKLADLFYLIQCSLSIFHHQD